MTPLAKHYLSSSRPVDIARDCDVTPETACAWRAGRVPGPHYQKRIEAAARAGMDGHPLTPLVREYLLARDERDRAADVLVSLRLAGDPAREDAIKYHSAKEAERRALAALREAMG
jgi:hypothetical protein